MRFTEQHHAANWNPPIALHHTGCHCKLQELASWTATPNNNENPCTNTSCLHFIASSYDFVTAFEAATSAKLAAMSLCPCSANESDVMKVEQELIRIVLAGMKQSSPTVMLQIQNTVFTASAAPKRPRALASSGRACGKERSWIFNGIAIHTCNASLCSLNEGSPITIQCEWCSNACGCNTASNTTVFGRNLCNSRSGRRYECNNDGSGSKKGPTPMIDA